MKASLLVALAAVLFLCATPRSHAQAAPADSVTLAKVPIRAVRLTAPVNVDGVLDEPIWSNDQAVTNFTQRDPVEGAPPSQRTEVRLAYDDDALYVGARLHDTAPDSIIARLTRRDVSIPADRFALYLDPLHDRRSGYYFLINAAGTLFDGTLSNDGWEDPSWDGVWEGKAKVDDKGWVVEMKIPYSQLRFSNQGEQCLWGVNFRRVIQRRTEEVYVVYQPKKAAGFVSRFPDLVGIEHIKAGSTFEVLPYVTGKADFLQHAEGDPFNDGQDLSPNAGLDLRTSLGSKLTMIGTINPDFGQVEVDPAVVNLSDQETFYPEKRPFFVEGSANFGFGQQGADDYWGFNWPEPVFFYSRRVGAAPSGGTPEAEYEDYPNGTTIIGAGKLTGKIAPSVNLGTLFAVTASENAQLSGNPNGITSFEVAPLTGFGVARFQKEFPERRQGLGLMVNGTARNLDNDVLKAQFNSSSLMAGLDGWWFLDKKKTYVVSGWTAMSHIAGDEIRIADVQLGPRHYFQRPDADEVRFDPTRTSLTGFGSRYWVNRQNGNMIFNSALGFMSPGFEVNDIGFMSRTDVINFHLGGGYKWTEPTKSRKYQHVIGAVFGSWDFDGNNTSAGVWASGNTEFSNNYTWEYRGAYNPQTTSTRLTRGGPRVITPPGYELGTYFDTDSKSKWFWIMDTGGYVQPDAHSYNYWVYPAVEFKPASNVTLRLGPGYEQVREYTQYIATIDNPANTQTYGADYVFATLDQRMLSANIRVNWAFNPTLSFQFYGQPLIAIGEYDDYKALAEPNTYEWNPYPIAPGSDNFNITSLRGNAVLRWEYRPGSAFYLVWTHDRYADSPVGQDFDFSGSRQRMFDLDADNIFLAKFTYYFAL